ncbi:MAG: hypothetical protein JWP66_670 [Naasia sp.]|nr:hypothetical protein [Naasia sp.]
MARFWLVVAVVAVAFMVYSLVDCAMADPRRIRGPRKLVWILIILLLPVLGGVLWFTIGRGRAVPSRPTRTVAPDDDPEFLSKLKKEADQAERIRRLEEELADLDSDSDPRRIDEAGDEPDRRDA